jgi:transposase-like protein
MGVKAVRETLNAQTNLAAARLRKCAKYANALIHEYEAPYPRVISILEEGLGDSLQFFSFQGIDARKISSANLLERRNKNTSSHEGRWNFS